MSLGLLAEQRFGPFFVTQFLGAFNDNVFKNALVVMLAFQAGRGMGLSTDVLINLSAGLFIAPFFLFSATAGQIADRAEKSQLMRRIKLAEIGIMVLACVGFWTGSVPFLMAVLFLMGTQSAFFGPVKYGILPQHLREEELVAGNGLVEMGTFLAILLGTIAGGLLIGVAGSGPLLICAALLLVSVSGWLSARRIPVAAAVDPTLPLSWNLFAQTWRVIGYTRANPTVFNSVLGISWFWFFGATFLAQIPNFAKQVLGGNEQVITLLLTVFSLGIGTGSMLCERLSGRLVEIGLVPFGAVGLTVFAFDLFLAAPAVPAGTLMGAGAYLASAGSLRVVLDLFAMAVFGGFFIVPLYALVQSRSPVEHRSRIIAGNNIINALFMVVSAAAAAAALEAGLSIAQLFAVVAVMNAVVAVYIFKLVPEFLMRFIVWMLMHTVYRLEVRGAENVPDRGPAVLVCNHVSFVDAALVTAACRRPVRFVMDHRIHGLPLLSFVFRATRTIPIAPAREDPARMEAAFDTIAEALEAGDVVGIFPEGRITGDGELSAFRPGIERIVARTPVPVVPMALRGVFGSFFSRDGGEAMTRPLRLLTRLRSRIELVLAPPVAPDQVRASALQEQVLALRGEWR